MLVSMANLSISWCANAQPAHPYLAALHIPSRLLNNYLEVKASLLKAEGEGPTVGLLNSRAPAGLSLSQLSTLSLSTSPFGNSAWDNLGDTSRL